MLTDYMISYDTQRYLSKYYLSEKSGQAMLHVTRNSLQTLFNVIRDNKSKKYLMLLVDSVQTLFYVSWNFRHSSFTLLFRCAIRLLLIIKYSSVKKMLF